MLPASISEDRASLRPHQRRPAVVLTFQWDDGAVQNLDLLRCDIIVRQS